MNIHKIADEWEDMVASCERTEWWSNVLREWRWHRHWRNIGKPGLEIVRGWEGSWRSTVPSPCKIAASGGQIIHYTRTASLVTVSYTIHTLLTSWGRHNPIHVFANKWACVYAIQDYGVWQDPAGGRRSAAPRLVRRVGRGDHVGLDIDIYGLNEEKEAIHCAPADHQCTRIVQDKILDHLWVLCNVSLVWWPDHLLPL